MRYRRVICLSNTSAPPLLSLIGLWLLAVVGFFLALPLFLAAMVVFGAVAGYLMWRVRRTLRRMERSLCETGASSATTEPGPSVIDITPPSENRPSLGPR